MAESAGLFLADFETGDVSSFTALVQEGTNSLTANASASLHGNYGALLTFDGVNNDCYGYRTITSAGTLCAREYFRLNSDFNTGTGTLILLSLNLSTTNRVYPRMAVAGGVVSIDRFYYQTDTGAAFVAVSGVTISKNTPHYIEIRVTQSSGANDGTAELYLDGTLISSATGIDNDTIVYDRLYSGQRGTVVPTSASLIYIDDLKLDSTAIGAYANVSDTAETLGIKANTTCGVSTLSQIGTAETVGIYSGSKSGVSALSSTAGPIIINHESVSDYDKIPAYYLNLIKENSYWFNLMGESHSMGYRIGLSLLNDIDSRYAVNVQESGSANLPITGYMRSSRASWGDRDHTTLWRYGYGEEDWYTSELARTATKRHIDYISTNGYGRTFIGFGWCWDASWHSYNQSATPDPVYGCRWFGSSEGGPEGDRTWGLDADDTAITENSVCMDTYLSATQEYIEYCEAQDNGVSPFFTTGPVDSYPDENGYQRHVKHEYIRNHVNSSGGFLFDYADILAWDNAGNQNLDTWSGHDYQMIAADNMLDIDGSYVEDGDHIGQRGALRIAKAVWVLVARMAGWDGLAADTANTVGIKSQSTCGVSTLSIYYYAVTVGIKSSSKVGISSAYREQLTVRGTINQDTGAISLSVPSWVDISALNPIIGYNGKMIDKTGPQDFTNPVTYTVTAEDLSTKSYTVTVVEI